MPDKQYYVYILANKRNGALYMSVTSGLPKRVYQHKNDLVAGFTQKYRVHDLVYYETTDDVNAAVTREKQVKKWEQAWKIRLIEERNPGWEDLDPLIGSIPPDRFPYRCLGAWVWAWSVCYAGGPWIPASAGMTSGISKRE